MGLINEEAVGADDKGPAFNDGTMLMMDEDDMGTMLMNGADDDEESDEQYADGTMLINDADTPRGGDQKEESDDIAFADSTMLINDIESLNLQPQREIKRIESVFERININQLLPIPDDVTRDELFAIFKRLKVVTVSDTQRLESWYREQIQILDDRIAMM